MNGYWALSTGRFTHAPVSGTVQSPQFAAPPIGGITGSLPDTGSLSVMCAEARSLYPTINPRRRVLLSGPHALTRGSELQAERAMLRQH
jgi:hypothetical protein